MKVFRTVKELREALISAPRPLGLVPTMGALHEGHLSLIRASALACETTAISIFVNPTQFGPKEDLSAYPRQEAEDLKLAEEAGAGFAFCPSVDEMYGGSTTTIHVAGVSEGFEGAIRPGHFDGVATVVAKLFHIFSPNIAFFGWKDLQQCAVIRRMIRDLNMPIDLRLIETVRNSGGLALSSRNAYLSPESRREAELIHQSLVTVKELILIHESGIESALAEGRARIESNNMTVDYLDLVDSETMTTLKSVTPEARLTVAVRKDGVRLLDNIPVIP